MTNTKNPSDTFCVMPFMSMATNTRGIFRPCNYSSSFTYKLNDSRLLENGYNISVHPVKDVWMGEAYKTMRNQMLTGVRPPECATCFKEFDSGVKSMREVHNASHPDIYRKVFLERDENSALAEYEVKHLDIRLGNLCNLKCRMCDSFSSSMWVDEYDSLGPLGRTIPIKLKPELSNMSWPTKDLTWDNIYSLCDTVEAISIMGGEPTLVKEQHRLLDHLIETGKCKNITLQYHTNLVNIQRPLMTKWNHFKQVNLACSIDGFGKLNDYIRYPSKWAAITNTLDKLCAPEYSNIKIRFHVAVQMYNILYLDALLDWAVPKGKAIMLTILDEPSELNISVLPPHLKKLAISRLDKYRHVAGVQYIVNYLNANDTSSSWDDFMKFTSILDANRHESVFDVVPEFKLIKNV